MIEVDSLDDGLTELEPFGSFPTWSLKDITKTDLPEHEGWQEKSFSFSA